MATDNEKAAEIVADRRELSAEKLRQEAVKQGLEVAKKATLKIVLRWINFGAAATIVGLFITMLFMNLQLFFGNLVNAPLIKEAKLSKWEVAFIIVLDALFAAGLAFSFITAYMLYHPWEIGKALTEWAVESGLCKFLSIKCPT